MVFLFNVNENNEQRKCGGLESSLMLHRSLGSSEVLLHCQWPEALERTVFYSLLYKVLWASVLEASSVCHANVHRDPWLVRDMRRQCWRRETGEQSKAKIPAPGKCWAGSTERVQTRDGASLSHVGARSGWSSQEGLCKEGKTRAENYIEGGKKN